MIWDWKGVLFEAVGGGLKTAASYKERKVEARTHMASRGESKSGFLLLREAGHAHLRGEKKSLGERKRDSGSLRLLVVFREEHKKLWQH